MKVTISPIKKAIRSALPFTPKPHLEILPADYVFVVQYFKNGGAERVINNYISALRKLYPSLKIAIVTTDRDDKITWHAGISENISFINLSPQVDSLSRYLRVRLLSKVLDRLSPRTIHIVNSKVALDLVASLDRDNLPYRIYASLFNSDFSVSGHSRTYYKELVPAAKNINRIFTDNASVIIEATTATSLPKALFQVHYQPSCTQTKPPHVLPKTGKIRVLWASRITHQKRPDILRKIAQQLNPTDFGISVYGAFDPAYDERFFATTPTISYCGGYEAFSDLKTENFDLFLYTSQADGLPNVLLEATSAGLPIVAPGVGGIGEFIKTDTGFLIKKFSDIDAYVSALANIAKTRPDLRSKILSAKSLLRSRHSFAQFTLAVKNDIIAK